MRQWSQIEAVVRIDDLKFTSDYEFQLRTVDKLHDRQSANGNDETRLQNANFIIHPQRTVANLIRRGHAVGASGVFSRKTTADGGEIYLRSSGGFVHSAKLFEPAEERFARRVRKRTFQRRFSRTRRLPNDHHVTHDRAA